jgi:hypothetical protein
MIAYSAILEFAERSINVGLSSVKFSPPAAKNEIGLSQIATTLFKCQMNKKVCELRSQKPNYLILGSTFLPELYGDLLQENHFSGSELL